MLAASRRTLNALEYGLSSYSIGDVAWPNWPNLFSPTVLDSQHIQGEGVPPQAGESQRHRRPDQRYLSLHPPTVSCLSQRTTKQRAGKWINSGRNKPLESGRPPHCRSFYIRGEYFKKKIQEGGEMCLLNQRPVLTEAGAAGFYIYHSPPGVTWIMKQWWTSGFDLAYWPTRWRMEDKDMKGERTVMAWVLAVPNVPRSGEKSSSSPLAAWMYLLSSL